MPESTYDPVLSAYEPATVRLLDPLRPPDPGRALVLVRHDGTTHTVMPGESVPSRFVGGYRTVVLVDMSEHRVALEMPLLSHDHTFAFRARVTVGCQVEDPAELYRRGIRDVADALGDEVRLHLQDVTSTHDITEFHAAQRALNRVEILGDRAIRILRTRVELLVDEGEVAQAGPALREALRAERLGKVRRTGALDMLREEGYEGLLAEMLVQEGPRAVAERIERAEESERVELISALKLVLERGDADREPFEMVEAERAVLDRVMRGSAAPFGGTRGGRVLGLGSMLTPSAPTDAALPAASRVEESPALPAASAPAPPAARPATPARPVVPVRPRPSRPVAPPEDEPLGPPAAAGSTHDADAPSSAEPVDAPAPRSRVIGFDVRPGGGR